MLPLVMRHNHTNYTCWGTICLIVMLQLPAEVRKESESGNFGGKKANLNFNQDDTDQSQE